MAKTLKRHTIDMNGWDAEYEELRLNILAGMLKKLKGQRVKVQA